jgi:effector-binding domain-containing protein
MVETARYEVTRRVEDMEIRSYNKLILATVSGIDGDDPFDILIKYISGNNKGRNKISMTTPVITPERIEMTTPVINKADSMSFVIPSKYTTENVPEPNDLRVKVHEEPARKLAVIRFRGYAGEKSVEKHTSRLLSALAQNGIEIVGQPVLMRYNPPWTPGFMRRNEVGVEIKE